MNTAQLTLLDHHLSEARRAAHLNQTRSADERFRDLVAKFDFRKLIDALTHVGPNGHRPGLQDGVEREVCEEAVRGLPGPAGVLDPIAPVVPWLAFAQRDVSDAASGGGYLVGSAADPVAEILRGYSVVVDGGAVVESGLRASVAIPRETTAPTFYWLPNETSAITDSAQVLGVAQMDPHMGGVHTKISRLLRLQSGPRLDDYLRRSLLGTVGAAIDSAAIQGAGGAAPHGIIGSAGVNAQSGGTFALSHVLAAREAVANSGANDQRVIWIGPPSVRKLLGAREAIATSGRMVWENDLIDNRPAFVSLGCPAATLVLGDFSLLTVGFWGAGPTIEATPNASAALFASSVVSLRVLIGADVALRCPSAFNVISSIT